MSTSPPPPVSLFENVRMGLGTSAWGDRVVWQYGRGYGAQDIRQAFETSFAEGIRFIDTAEIYGSGNSERFVGEFIKGRESELLVATKFFPWPWRLIGASVVKALRGSLLRLGLPRVSLYQLHNPTSPIGIETLAEALGQCVELGLAQAVGVSNFDEQQMLRAYTTLARQGVQLASNQVHFSLLHRQPETSGLLSRCNELGIRLIAYSPLEMGLLTGKYGRSHLPPGSRAFRFPGIMGRLQPLLRLMTEIGQDQGGKSNAQVALNWVVSKGALPIPGAKNAAQAQDNAAAVNWSLTANEVAALDAASESFQ